MFINLRNKPKWFLELVPKGLVPVAKIKDKILPESYEILKVEGVQGDLATPLLMSSAVWLRKLHNKRKSSSVLLNS